MLEQLVKFAVGGPVQVKDGTYLLRPADTDLFHACQAGEFAYVLASRQIGKSSLMFATAKRLDKAGIRTALIDLSSIGKEGVSAESWYFSLIGELVQRLELKLDVQTWWEKRPPLSTLPQRFLGFLHEVVLQEITQPLVIFIDEIDVTLRLDFRDDFFAAIRYVYNDRAQDPVYRRLTFVLLGVATPDELIKDHARTPFNIGQAIVLDDFTQSECKPFQLAIENRYLDPSCFDQIYDWTAGHPYLTQKLTQAVLAASEQNRADLVDRLVDKIFLAPPDRSDDNLQFVESRVSDDPHLREMLSLYKRILQDEEALEDETSPAINRLKLYGLVKIKDGQLRVRNRIYAQAFNVTWANELLEKSTRLALGLPRRYKVVQEIDQGGFATIYLAETKLASGETQQVALKVLNLREESNQNSARLIRRFERETIAIARLKHPNIIQIHETGRSETGRGDTLFIAMEYFPGGTIRRRLKQEGPLPRDEAVEIIKQVGNALAYAHSQGIIHRDVKPDNILLDTSQGLIRPVLTDFGLAKDLSPGDGDSHTSRPLGTTAYMAPEQLAPERWKQRMPTPATDIYALAITFFEMLVGTHPFDTDSDHKLTGAELAERHLNDPLPALEKSVQGVGLFFDNILQKATAKNPQDRYQDVTEFIEALDIANNEARQSRADKLVEVARGYAQDGDVRTALEMTDRALGISPGHIDALRLRGLINFEQGELIAALENYRQAYQQVRNPSSPAGRDYLDILKHLAQTAWQQSAYQQTIDYYQVIKQVLDTDHTQDASIQEWLAVWTEFVEKHYQAGMLGYNEGHPENIGEATKILKRELKVLRSLQAGPETQDLQEKLRLLQIKLHYSAGQTAYADSNPQDIDMAVKVLQREIQALEKLGAEAEIKDLQQKLIFCHHLVGDQAYAGGQPENMIEAIETLEREIGALKKLNAEQTSQDLQEKLNLLQVKLYYRDGHEAYATGSPEDIDEAIEFLENRIQALGTLKATAESHDLSQKLKQLKVDKHRRIIETAITAISHPSEGEDIFHHYDRIDEAYQTLIHLEPEKEQWQTQRREKLVKQAQHRQEFARRAEVSHKYADALRHYTAIHDIEQTKEHGGLAQALKLDLAAKLADLERKVAYDRKYHEIEKLIDNREYANALNQLVEDFIKQGNYEHREVTRLLWGLTYAKQHDWQYPPPEWTSATNLNTLNAQLTEANTEVARLRSQLAEQEQNQSAVDKPQEQLTAIAMSSLIAFLIIGGVMGILITIIAPQIQNLPWLLIIAVSAVVILISLRIILINRLDK